jgi:lysophosphatidylcholine acyltransferase/lyso-PAF acetyltransferase
MNKSKSFFLKKAPIFVAAPHSSFFDAFVFFILGLPSSVSRSENAKLPFLGKVVAATQPILVTREDSKNKLFTIEEIKRRTNPENDWPQLLVS